MNKTVIKWTNQNLPHDNPPFTPHEFLQCIGVFVVWTLLGWSKQCNKSLTNKRYWVLSAVSLQERFGLSQDHFLFWKKYLKLWPPETNRHTWDVLKGLIVHVECQMM